MSGRLEPRQIKKRELGNAKKTLLPRRAPDDKKMERGRVVGDLTFDSDDLPRSNGFDEREASGHVWQQVFQTV